MKIKKIIVIKIGSSVLMTQRQKLDEFRIAHLANQLAALREAGFGVVLVVSGAVACGYQLIKFSKDQRFLKQAAAGIGQAILTSAFTGIFDQKKMQIAQLLLIKDNLDSNSERQKIRELLDFYVQSGFVPMINENDVLDLNSFGGNDYLAAEMTTLIKAERLLVLSTEEGSPFGVGGGEAKQEAVDLMKLRNIKTDILEGRARDIILKTIL